MARVGAVYDRLKINAELAPFFGDLPARMASSHLVVALRRTGTVAELATIGRPSILVPLPARSIRTRSPTPPYWNGQGGAIRIAQARFTPPTASLPEISALASAPARVPGWPRWRPRSQGASTPPSGWPIW